MFRQLGNTPIYITPVGLGSMPLALRGRPDEKEAIAVIHHALDLGVNFIDTADVYCQDDKDIGYCEKLIAKALQSWEPRDDTHNHHPNSHLMKALGKPILVATKGGMERPGGSWTVNGSPEHLKRACEASLKALNVDCIDLYQWHAPDSYVSFEESMNALVNLKNIGKIRYLGLSNVSLEQLKTARQMVEIVSVQNRCSPYNTKNFQDGLVEYCEKEKISYIAYSPVGGGNYKATTAKESHLLQVAKEHDATPYQIAIAWLLAKSPAIIPIPGASRVESIASSVQALDIKLKDTDIQFLDKAFIK